MVLRTHGISTIDYSFDESASWKTIQFSWPEMFDSISRNVHPPAFYVLLKLWASAFGDGPVSLRLFSVLFGTLTIWAAWWFVKEASVRDGSGNSGSGVAAPLIAAALLAFSPAHVSLGLIARMYTLGTFLALVASTFAVRILRTGGTARDWTGCAIAGVLLTLTHYYGLFTAAALAVVVLVRAIYEGVVHGWTPITRRLLIGGFLAAWGAASVWRFWLPTFLAQRAQVNQDYWIADFEWSHLSSAWTSLLAGNETGAEALIPPWSCLIFAALASLLSIVCCGRAGRVAGAAAIVPVIAATAISMHSQSIIVWRYFIFSQTFVLCGWALLVVCLRSLELRAVVIGLSVGWLAGWSLQLWHRQSWEADGRGWRYVAVALDERREDHEPVLVYDPASYLIIQRYVVKRDNLFVIDRGYDYTHYHAGPMLKPTDYRSIEDFSEATRSIVVVHLPDWFSAIPRGWTEHRSRVFESRVGRRRSVVVRELHRESAQPQ